MTPLRAQMIRDMQLQRLAADPKPMSPLWLVWPSSTSAPRSAYVQSRFVRTCTTS